MDLEKAVKFIETCFRDYIFSILSVIWMPRSRFDKDQEGTADKVLLADQGRTWSFAVISIVIALLLYAASYKLYLSYKTFPYWMLLRTLFFWILFAGFCHIFIRLMRGCGNYLDTLSACLRVMPTAFVISAFSAFTFASFEKVTNCHSYSRIIEPSTVFLVTQFVFILFYLPAALRQVHKLRIFGQILLSFWLPFFVLLANLLIGSSEESNKRNVDLKIIKDLHNNLVVDVPIPGKFIIETDPFLPPITVGPFPPPPKPTSNELISEGILSRLDSIDKFFMEKPLGLLDSFRSLDKKDARDLVVINGPRVAIAQQTALYDTPRCIFDVLRAKINNFL